MDMPPTRYRVVEQGRRLIVIDMQAERSSTPPAVISRREMPFGRPDALEASRPRAGGTEPRGRHAGGEGFSFVTARWYDGAGPRRIRLDQDGATQLIAVLLIALVVAGFFVALIGWPVLLVLGFLTFNARVRSGLGKAGATWLTALDKGQ